MCRLLWEVLISVLALLAREVDLLLGEPCPFIKDRVKCIVLSFLRFEVLPLALADVDRHLLHLLLGIVDFGSHEGH